MENNKFIQIPLEIVKNKNIREIDKSVYGVILFLSHLEGYCWSSNKYIADTLGISPTSITSCLIRLENEHFIIREDKNSLKRKLIPQIVIDVVNIYQPKSKDDLTSVKQQDKPKSNDNHIIQDIIQDNIILEPVKNKIDNSTITHLITLFKEVSSGYTTFYKIPSYRKSLARLLEVHTPSEIEARLKYAFKEMKSGNKFAIQIRTPQDLENKWDKIAIPKIENEPVDNLLEKYNAK